MFPVVARVMASLVLVCALTAGAQQNSSATADPQPQKPAAEVQSPDLAQLGAWVKAQFGPSFKLSPIYPRGVGGQKLTNKPPILLLTSDLDGDGAEDAIIVVQSKNPLRDEQQFGYRVIDPYDAYFGYGDPRITREFATGDPDNEHALLIVHNWRAPQPKLKFVVINLPFDKLAIGSATHKKKQRNTLVATEAGLLESIIYWDGKKYRYEPNSGPVDPDEEVEK